MPGYFPEVALLIDVVDLLEPDLEELLDALEVVRLFAVVVVGVSHPQAAVAHPNASR